MGPRPCTPCHADGKTSYRFTPGRNIKFHQDVRCNANPMNPYLSAAMPDSATLVWILVLITLVPGGALLAGMHVSANARAGLLLACTGAWLAMACLVCTTAAAYQWPHLLF